MVDAPKDQECPFCKETIKAGAVKCRFCGSPLLARTLEHDGVCPFCKEEIKPGAVKCRHCHSYLGKLAEARAIMRRRTAGQGCGCAGRDRLPDATAARSPADDWIDCAEYCFLLTLGEEPGYSHCITYRCGGFVTQPEF